jgi:glycosyltransferase involved in cell wall biosynthesis
VTHRDAASNNRAVRSGPSEPLVRVGISVLGRFHAFDLAQQLQRYGALAQLITSYPRQLTDRWGIERGHVTPLLFMELGRRAESMLPDALQRGWTTHYRLCEWYDRLASQALDPTSDVVVGWAGTALHTLRRARAEGAKTVVERGSTHIEYQMTVLEEEFEAWGLRFRGANQPLMERELQEYAECDRIAVPSQFVRQTFINKGFSPEKLIRVPYGVSTKEFWPVPTGAQPFRIIHCGAISIRKGIPYLVKAFHRLGLPDAELWLVGPVHEDVKPILARYAHPRIILKGTYPQAMLRELYSQCAVFCLASVEEGLAMTIPQAMACGLPVIYTGNTGGDDIVRDGIDGIRVLERDVSALEAALLTIYENPERREAMGQSARRRAVETFTWERYGLEILAAYQTLLSAADTRGEGKSLHTNSTNTSAL